MKKRLPASVLLALLTGWLAHSAIVKELVIAPQLESDLMATDADHDFFADCPVYGIEAPQQVYAQGAWKSFDERDQQVKLRLAWNEQAIFMRFDFVDNVNVPIVEPKPGDLRGDYLELGFISSTVGVKRQAGAPWTLILCPNVKAKSCAVTINAADDETRGLVGDPAAIETRLFQEQELTSLLVRIPVTLWEVPPRSNSFLRFQGVYHDADSANEPPKILTQFPVRRGIDTPATHAPGYGEIRFVDRVWMSVRPTQILFPEAKIDLLVDYGNLSETAVKLNLLVDPYTSGPTAKTFAEVLELKPGTTQQGIPYTLPLEDLPSGDYRLKTTAGLYYDSGQVIFSKPKGANLIYLPQYIDPQRRLDESSLPVLSREENHEILRYMAGGGRVLWSAGQYDASSQEFRGILRPAGAVDLKLPEATRNEVPWALFGGLDYLDATGEPLTISIDSSLLTDDGGIAPELPEFDYLTADRNRKRLSVRAKRLLLLGLVYDYVDEQSFPMIEVLDSQNRPVLRETLAAAPGTGPGSRHVYVLRLWIEPPTQAGEVLRYSVANVSTFGPKAEIDFIALIGAGDRTTYSEGQPGLYFSGCAEAEIFTRQLATSLYFMRQYLVGPTGNCYAGLPGGRREEAHPADTGMLLDEFSRWGASTEAKRMVTALPARITELRSQYRRTGALTLGHPTLISALHQVWRRDPEGNDFLRRIWLATVHLPATDISAELGRNPMNLVAADGELGAVGPKSPASTMPMAQASRAALLDAADMASALGFTQSAATWKRDATTLEQSIERYLQAPPGDLRVSTQETFPAAYGLPAHEGLADTIPHKVWLFGRYADGSPMLYNGNLRVYDTPYLFAGLPFVMDSRGFILDNAYRANAQTTLNYLFIISPLFQGNQLAFINAGVLDYKDSQVQLWTAMAATMLDNFPIATRLIDAYVRYTFDEYLRLPAGPNRANLEVSPYTFEEKLNARGQKPCLNLAPSGDDLTAGQGALALRLARLLAGVDDTDLDNLLLAPRLPDRWDQVEARGWEITHRFPNATVDKIDFSYQRLVNDRYVLTLKSPKLLRQVTVRLGPFPANVRRVELAGDSGARERLTTVNENGIVWAIKSYRNVERLEISVRPSF